MKKQLKTLLALGLAMGMSASAAAQDYGTPPQPLGPDGEPLGRSGQPLGGPDGDELIVPSATDSLEYSQRGITLPSGTLRADLTFGIDHISIDTGFGTVNDTATFFSLGVAFGVMDNLELGVSGYRQGAMSTGTFTGAIPLQLTDDFNFGFVTPYARFRVLHNELLQLAAEVTVILPTASHSDFGLLSGVPFRLMLNQTFAFDFGLFFQATFADSTVTDLIIPFGLVANATPELFLLARLKFIYADFEDRVVPLDFGAGYTIAGGDGAPMVDLMATFGFPFFLVNGDTFTEFWEVNLGARFRLGT